MLVGGGTVKQIPSMLGRMGVSNPFILTDKFLEGNGTVGKIQSALDEGSVPYRTFSDTIPDPTTDSVDLVIEALKAGNHDSIIAVGGGSPMDTAKAAAMLAAHGGKMRDYKAPFMMDKPCLPMIAVPTTAGTGSEVSLILTLTLTLTLTLVLGHQGHHHF